MMKKSLAALFFLVWAQAALAATLHIGSVNQDPAREIKKFLPVANYLGKQLAPVGYDRAQVVVAPTLPDMARLMRDGQVDFYIDSPVPSLALSRMAGSKLLLRRWKKGVSEYYAVIFARNDSGINRLADLKGKIIVFEAPYSSSGYFLPRMVLLQEKIPMTPADAPAKNRLGYRFSGSEANSLAWVLMGKVDAGALDHESLVYTAGENIDRIHIVHRSFSIPRHVVSHRGDLSPELVGSVKRVLLAMEQSEAGRTALMDFERTTRFDALPPSAMAPIVRGWKFIDSDFALR
jgi:phosphonate transport system substrate-binding protein